MSTGSDFLAGDAGNWQPTRRLTHTSLSALAIILIILLAVAGPWFITSRSVKFTGDGSPLRQYSYILVFFMVVLSCQLHQYPRRIFVLSSSVTVALLYCWMSLSWSIAPGIAARRLMLTTIIVWSIFAVVQKVGFEHAIRCIRISMIYVLVLNFAAVILLPHIGVHQESGFAPVGDPGLVGDWRGVMIQKNFAGAFCALTILMYLFCNRKMKPYPKWFMIIGSFVFLVQSNSKTSLGLLLISVAAGYLLSRYQARFRILAAPASLVILGLCSLLVYIYWDIVSLPFQGDDALTGRVQIWPVLIDYAYNNWWFGAGYGSFWNVGPSGPITAYVSARNWVGELGNGHNGYLDLLITIGFPGLCVVVAAVFIVPLITLFSDLRIADEQRGLVIALLLFCAFHNFTESSLFDRDMVVNVFFMFTLALLGAARRNGAQIDIGADAIGDPINYKGKST